MIRFIIHRIPRVQTYIRSLVPETIQVRLPNSEGLDADEVIAIGCGIQAGVLASVADQGGVPTEGPVGHLSQPIGVVVPSDNGEEKPVWVLPKFAAVPFRRTFAVGGREKGADSAFLRIVEGAEKGFKTLIELAIPLEGEETAKVTITAELDAVTAIAECGGRLVRARSAREGSK